MTCVVDERRQAARHHHRRRPAAADGARRPTSSICSPPTSMTRGPVSIAPSTLAGGGARTSWSSGKSRRSSSWTRRLAQVAGVVHLHDSVADGNGLSTGYGDHEPPGQLFRRKPPRIRLLLFDVDGVLTDGAVTIHGDGSESKRFGIRDGIAMVWAQRAGLKVGLPVGAPFGHDAASRRAARHHARPPGCARTRSSGLRRILKDEALNDEDVAYMGDDIVDLAVLARVGLSAAPADAVAEVRERVDWVSRANGGCGAARELVETVLRAQSRWDAIVGSLPA